jgi:hypothetical protein
MVSMDDLNSLLNKQVGKKASSINLLINPNLPFTWKVKWCLRTLQPDNGSQTH